VDIDLEPGALVIADLHLDASSAEAHAPFRDFLAAASDRSTLLILGDLFDAWVGPAHARLPGASSILAALRRAGDSPAGILAKLPDASLALFLHGDELCTLDHAYQRMKRIVRSRPARWLAPRLPDSLALGVARRMRKVSKHAVMNKPSETKRQQVEEVRARAGAAGAETLICGHAHEFRDERLPQGPRWLVLDAFGGAHDLLELNSAGTLEARSSAGLKRS
jgi:UDP-2,3-diacylglucosamine hydrolase